MIHSSLGYARDENRVAVFTETFPRSVSTDKLTAWIRALPAVERAQWEALIAKHQGQAFTMSGINQRKVLEDLRDLIARSLESRLTPEQFDRAARELLRNYQITGARLRTVWNQTVSNSIREARAEEVRDPEVRAAIPFAMFDAILDSRVRPNHAAMEGAIAPIEWWEGSELSPVPNGLGFNCRCQLIYMNSIRARKLVEKGDPYFRIDLEGPRAGAARDDKYPRFAEALPAPERTLIGQPNLPLSVRREIWEMAVDAKRLEAVIRLSFAKFLAAAATDWWAAARRALARGDSNPVELLPEVAQASVGQTFLSVHRREISEALAAAEVVGHLRVREQAGISPSTPLRVISALRGIQRAA